MRLGSKLLQLRRLSASFLSILLISSMNSVAVVRLDAQETDNHELSSRASHILIGQVNNVESMWNDDETLIYSYVRISIEQCLKGGYQGKEAVIRVLGGEIGSIGLGASDQPSFLKSERVKVFLKSDGNGEFSVVGGKRGKISLSRDEPLSPGFSYDGIHWADSDIPVPYYINELGTPDTTDEFTAVQNSFQAWEDDPGSYIDYTYVGTTTLSGDIRNDVNVVSWESVDGSGGTLAFCHYWYYTATLLLIEFDIVFDEDETWSTTGEAGKYDVQNVGTHEVGHTLHLLDLYDSADSEETMYGYASTGETKKRTLHTGDIAGVRFIYPVGGPNGPRTSNLLIHMYLNPDSEFYALELCEIDIVDWYLTDDWVNRWSEPGYECIRMVRAGAEMEWYELTFNHQVWPTGWRDYYSNPPGELEQFDPGVQRHIDAKHFRTAIAYLTDKAQYIAMVMNGYGIRTEASKPATVGWISPNLVEWPFDVAAAVAELTAGGFQDYDGDGILEWDVDRDGVGYEELPALEIWGRLDDIARGDSCDLLVAEMQSVGIPINYHKELAWPCYQAVMMGTPPGVNLPANWPDVTHWLPFIDTNADGSPEWCAGMKRFHMYTSRRVLEAPTHDHYCDLYVASMATEAEGKFSTNYGGFYVGDGVLDYPDEPDYEYWASQAKFGTTQAECKDGVYRCQEIAQEFWPTMPWFSPIIVKAYKHCNGEDGIFEWWWEPGVDDTGWFGVVNMRGYGIDNPWSFLNMHAVPDDYTIDWGFRNEPFQLNVITSNQPHEWKILKLVYESLIGMDSFNFAEDYPWLAEAMAPGPDGVYGSPTNPVGYFDDVWAETEVWCDPDATPGTGDERMALTMRLREGITFHNGDPVTPDDVKFSFLFRRDCGPGVAFEYPSVMCIDYVDTQADDPALGPRDIKVYFGVSGLSLLYWIGYLGILDRNIWMAVNDAGGWGYRWPRGSGFVEDSWVAGGKLYVRTSEHPGNPCEITVSEDVYIALDPMNPTANVGPYHVDSKTQDVDGTWIFELSSATAPIAEAPIGSRLDKFPGDGTGWDSISVTSYQPWLEDHDYDGDVDLKEDGTGPWIFESWDPGNFILLFAHAGYHKTQQEIHDYKIESFHRCGNINYPGSFYEATYQATIGIDMKINIMDLMYFARSFGTNEREYPHGTNYMEYNVDADLNRDGEVWIYEYITLATNFGREAG